jgi:transposase
MAYCSHSKRETMTEPKTTFANGINPFVAPVVRPEVSIDDVCLFFKNIGRVSTTYEATKHFGISSAMVTRFIARLHKQKLLLQSLKSGHGGKYGYTYAGDASLSRSGQIPRIKDLLTRKPGLTAREVSAELRINAPGRTLSSMLTNRQLTYVGVAGSYRYYIA